MANIFKALIPVGLIIGAVFGLSKMGGGAKPGEPVMIGSKTGVTNEKAYEWRVIHSEEGAEFPFAAQVREAGFGDWTIESIVAWGNTADETKMAMMTWFLDNT